MFVYVIYLAIFMQSGIFSELYCCVLISGSNMEILEIRRQNLRKLMRDMGANNLAVKLGYRQSSFLSQMAGPNPTRDITEKTARAYEKSLELPSGALDAPQEPGPGLQSGKIPLPGAEAAPALVSTADMITIVLQATRSLGRVAEAQEVSLPPNKFGNVLAMIIKDASEHGGQVRHEYIAEVVELLK